MDSAFDQEGHERWLNEAEAVAGIEDEGTHVVLGAAKPLGRAVVMKLVAQSKKVKAVFFDRGAVVEGFGTSVETTAVDPFQAQSIAEVCRSAKTVYDCFEPSYSSWTKAMPEVTGNVLLAAIDVGATIVFASHLVKSEADNAHMENDILNAHGSGLTRTVVARIPQLYGARVLNPMWRLVFDSALEGKKAHWVGDLEVRRSLIDVDDAAEAMIALAAEPKAHGKAWSVASPVPLTGREFIELAFKAAGNAPKVGKWGRGIVLTGSLLATDTRAILEMPYDYYSPFVVDASEFSEKFPSFPYTAPDKSVAKSLSWYREQLAVP